MRGYLRRWSGTLNKILRVLVLFAIARLAFGVFAIAFLSDGGLAYGVRATVILALAFVIGIAVALFVRRGPRDAPRTAHDAESKQIPMRRRR